MPMTLDGTSGMVAPAGAVYNGLNTFTALTPSTGTSVSFTGVPLWCKRVTLLMAGVSTSGGNNLQFRFGSGSFATTGYIGGTVQPNNMAVNSSGAGTSNVVLDFNVSGSSVISGFVTCTNVANNIWIITGSCGDPVNDRYFLYNWYNNLSGSLDRVQILTSGTDTFDAGTVNVIYE